MLMSRLIKSGNLIVANDCSYIGLQIFLSSAHTQQNNISNFINQMITLLCYLIVLFCCCQSNVNIDNFGAIPFKDDLASQQANSNAILEAVKAAELQLDRMVLIPNKTYYIMPVRFENLTRIAIYNRGTLVASTSVDDWPKQGKAYKSLVEFINCSDISLFGGTINGRGYHWWLLTLHDPSHKLPSQGDRPHLLKLQQCISCHLSQLHLRNSPQFHILILDSLNLTISHIKITVNRTSQLQLLHKYNLPLVTPMFPFNTDGIDPQGTNIHIYNITCENYNDIVVVKPNNPKGRLSQCSQNILIENVSSWWGSGMSIGTVQRGDCVRNVTFREVKMRHPFKGIYVKTYPGGSGVGVIEKVTYQNMRIWNPIYWAIYIGPHKDGPGCLNIQKCTPQPKVTIRDIHFKNITISKGGLYPYMIYCSPANPCQNITFQQVNAHGWLTGGKPPRCLNAHLTQSLSSPFLNCLETTTPII